MTPADFRAALAELGLTETLAAAVLRVDVRTIRRWKQEPGTKGHRAMPGPAVAMVEQMLLASRKLAPSAASSRS